MTINTIEQKARQLLFDTIEEYRWTSDEIREALVEAIRTLNSIRPETRYVEGRLVDVLPLSDNVNEKILIEDRYEEALVFYVVYKCYLKDDTDTVNAELAERYLSKFNTKAQI